MFVRRTTAIPGDDRGSSARTADTAPSCTLLENIYTTYSDRFWALSSSRIRTSKASHSHTYWFTCLRTCKWALLKRSAVVGSGGGALGAFTGLTFFCVPCCLLSAEPLTAGAAVVAGGLVASRVTGAGETATLCAGVFVMLDAIGRPAALGWAAVPGSVCNLCRSASICAMASLRADMLQDCIERALFRYYYAVDQTAMPTQVQSSEVQTTGVYLPCPLTRSPSIQNRSPCRSVYYSAIQQKSTWCSWVWMPCSAERPPASQRQRSVALGGLPFRAITYVYNALLHCALRALWAPFGQLRC